MPVPTVFISYSHKDEVWKDKLVPHLHALETAGVEMLVWQDRRIDGGEKWYPEIQDAMANAAAAILLISSDFLASRFCIQEEVPALLKRQEEQGMLLIPVLLRQCPWKAHRWLKDRQMIPRDGKCVAIDFAGDLTDAVFTSVADQIFSRFEQLAAQSAAQVVVPASVQLLVAERTVSIDARIVPPAPTIPWPTLPAERVDLTRLPETGAALFGRDEELARLDETWAKAEQGTATRILAFTAQGGVGKSTLVNQWLVDMSRDHYRGATRVFGWSFYSQGVRAETAASADTFIAAALRFFGDEDPAEGSPWDKGGRLAHLVGSERALLVLDGLEPLQSAHAFERGKIHDPALESLLRGLARRSAGLCLITTREPITDLADRPAVTMRDLEQITPQAGRALLRTARVVGTDAELEALASRFGPHALAVSLLGVYLREQPGHGIGPSNALEELPGKEPIDRVLAAFEQWLGDSTEREALRLLGFFDRPADAGCLRALREAPAIPGLTERMAAVSDTEWDRVLFRLEELRLVHVLRGRSGQHLVDAHPLIREHFASLLKGGDAWREGHCRLYKYLCANTLEGDEPSLEDLQPLYQAVAHGCQAGMHQEACYEVYHARIKRQHDNYSTRKLGAFGSDLGAVACFFEDPWRGVSPALTETLHAWLLNQAAVYLRALGRLTEALEPMRAGLEMLIKQENWREAARSACNLGELELTLGKVGNPKQLLIYADRSGDGFQRAVNTCTAANALHQAGRCADAKTLFRKAENLQRKSQPGYPRLYSLQGFQYCDMLLAAPERAAWQHIFRSSRFRPADSEVLPETLQRAPTRQKLPPHEDATLGGAQDAPRREEDPQIQSCHDVAKRAEQTLKWVEAARKDILSIALDHLTLGRAALYEAVLAEASLEPCRASLRRSLDGLRQAGAQHHIPGGLLTRGWLRSLSGAHAGPEGAQSDLDEAWEIAERGPMKLFMVDIHLHRARLFFREPHYPWDKNPDGTARGPEDDLAAAEKLINECGYHRRDEELADAKRAILVQST